MDKSLPKVMKIAPHVIDTFLLISALVLCILLKQYPFVDQWLTLKLAFVVAYIVAAIFAMKSKVKWKSVSLFVLAIFCLVSAAKVAVMKTSF